MFVKQVAMWCFMASMASALGGSWATAQTVGATTGSIIGRVTDTSSGVLPGVTVTITSTAMQGERSDTTSGEGEYHFVAVPPGDYKVTYALSGFSTVVRDRIHVGLGFTATINTELKIAALEEAVTVTGASPVVDVTTNKIATVFEAQQLASLPNARDYWSIVAAAPAVQMQRIDVGGSAAGTQTGYSAYDTKADQNRPVVEGIVNTEGTNSAGYYYDYGAFEQVSIGSGTNSAEMPWPGVLSQFVVKSGGNTYHGNVYDDYENRNIQSSNISASQIALGVKGGPTVAAADLNQMYQYYDMDGDLGGYVVPDKLWWYGALRNQDIQNLLPGFPVKPFETNLRNITAKATYALSSNNKIVGFGMWGRKAEPNRLDTYLISAASAVHDTADSTENQLYWAHTYKAEWDRVLSNRMFLEVRGGQFGYNWPYTNYSNARETVDLATNVVTGGDQGGWWDNRRRNQVAGSFSLLKDRWLGSHSFKFGGEIFNETTQYLRGAGGAGDVPQDVLQVMNNGTPANVYLFASPVDSRTGLRTYGVYASDTWRASGKLTLNLGIVFDHYRSYLPAQVGPPVGGPLAQIGALTTQQTFAANNDLLTWNLPAPRLGFTYDLLGDGKTVLKGSYGQYWWNPGTSNVAELVNQNPVDWYSEYTWTNSTNNGVWQPGQQGRLIASKGGNGSAILDRTLQDTYTREAAAWIERELAPNFGVHVGVIWRGINQLSQLNNQNRPYSAFNVPVLITNPFGAPIAGFNLNPANLSLPVVNILENTPGHDDFYTLELGANRRMSGRWSLNGSFSYRWNYDNATGYMGNSFLRPSGDPDVANPNDTINTDNGRFDFTLWSAKFNGTYDGPWGLRITPAVRNQSGQPYGAVLVATAANGINYGTQRILTQSISTNRQDNITVVDLRVEKSLHVGQHETLSAFVDGYNLFNANPGIAVNWQLGSTYLQPTNILAPRIARFGVKFAW